MKNLYVIVLLSIFFTCSCNRRDDEEELKPEIIDETLYDPTKEFRTLFVFHVSDQNKDAFNYWFDIEKITQTKPYHKTISSSDDLEGKLTRLPHPERKNTVILVTDDNLLTHKFLITIHVSELRRCPTCETEKIYRSDTLKFKNIKDTIRVIRYPQDTLTMVKRLQRRPY